MEPLKITGICNGWIVDSGTIWRGAQPTDDAWARLAAIGCRSVLDLNTCGSEAQAKQLNLVHASGMSYKPLGWGGVLPPFQTQIRTALAWIDGEIKAGRSPVFIHCQHGSDRTGTLCAIWRMHHDGWSFEKAMEESFTRLGLQGMHEFWMAAAVAEYAHANHRAV